MNPAQTEGNVDSCLYSRGRAQTNHMKNMTQEKESFYIISVVELDHRRLLAKTLVNKMGLIYK